MSDSSLRDTIRNRWQYSPYAGTDKEIVLSDVISSFMEKHSLLTFDPAALRDRVALTISNMLSSDVNFIMDRSDKQNAKHAQLTSYKLSPREGVVINTNIATSNDHIPETASKGAELTIDKIPQSFKEYLTKCLEPVKSDRYLRTVMMEFIEKHISTPAIQNNTLYSIDWSTAKPISIDKVLDQINRHAKTQNKPIIDNLSFRSSRLQQQPKRPRFSSFRPQEEEEEHQPIIGTSEELEKHYFRIIEAVSPDSVRPERVLVRSLDHCIRKYSESQDYGWLSSQLKSIRQDMVVQNIKSRLTVKVYEANFTFALENHDHIEYGQCLAKLSTLTREVNCGHRAEFDGYYIVDAALDNRIRELNEFMETLIAEKEQEYNVLLGSDYSGLPKHNRDSTKHPLTNVYAISPFDETENPLEIIDFAFKVVDIVLHQDWLGFFQLKSSAPLLTGKLMESNEHIMREKAFRTICLSIRPNISLSSLCSMFCVPFQNTDQTLHSDARDLKKYALARGAEEIASKDEDCPDNILLQLKPAYDALSEGKWKTAAQREEVERLEKLLGDDARRAKL